MKDELPAGPTTPEDRPGGLPEDHPAPKFLVVLLDISDSMSQVRSGHSRAPIAELNDKLGRYIAQVPNSSFGRSGQLAICAFYEATQDVPTFHWLPLGRAVRDGSSVHYAADAELKRSNGTRIDLEKDGLGLVARGLTPLGSAVAEALDCIEERVDELATLGRQTNPRPVLLVLTDGLPTDPDRVAEVAQRVHQMEDEHKLAFWVGGMKGASREALADLANKGNFIELGDTGIDAFLQLMSLSVTAAEGPRRTAEMIYADLNKRLTALG